MNRRKFLKISTLGAGAAIIGGGAAYIMFKDSDPLKPFYEATQTVFIARFGHDFSTALLEETRQAYEGLRSEIPYIGGEENMFTEWLNYGAYYLAMHQAFSAHGHTVDDVGMLIFEA